jgi:hypothetical protein
MRWPSRSCRRRSPAVATTMGHHRRGGVHGSGREGCAEAQSSSKGGERRSALPSLPWAPRFPVVKPLVKGEATGESLVRRVCCGCGRSVAGEGAREATEARVLENGCRVPKPGVPKTPEDSASQNP